ncbi:MULTISPECIES: nuclear transport factor 2 family protein [Actinomadura]|uniref:nuclear transport factor 2 family protein n=1 Tax=Actinomadura TaxID=1988 RepID=UPI0026097FDA|nr:nuclear transport factor 2 family protein [Actinomadura geliboluensis]
MDFDIDEFGNHYIAVWNEPDPDVRHNLIAALWDDEAVEFTDSAEYRGLPAIEARIAEAHEHLVKQGGFTFRAARDAVGHHGTVRFTTYMTPAAGAEAAWTGFVFARLGDDGRIHKDYQFGNPPPPVVPEQPQPTTRAVVHKFLRRSRQGDPDHIADLYAPEVSWRVNWPVEEHPAVPWIRPRSTRADAADHFRTFAEHCLPAEGRVSIDEALIDGPDAVLIGTSRQRLKDTGNRFTRTFALRLTIEDVRITRHHMYEDSLAVAKSFPTN